MASNVTPNAVTSTSDWKFQNSYIERLMDHSALTAVHPSDTLVMAGPPRYLPNSEAQDIFDNMLPLGMLQQINFGQQLPVTPGQAIGSGRGFYLIDKAQGTATLARLYLKGRNLLRALYTNVVRAGLDVTKFDDRAAAKKTSGFYANLDSELFKIPFGLAVLLRDKLHDNVGAFFLELCQITSWNMGVSAGQSMVMENVNLMFDRLYVMDGEADLPPYPEGLDEDIFGAIFHGDSSVATTPYLEDK